MYFCYNCRKKIEINFPIDKSAVCRECGAFLRVCLNCKFYSHFAPHECKEPAAPIIMDKEKPNSCQFFEFLEQKEEEKEIKEKAIKEWEELFKKGQS
ncbi:hypothetical protein NLC82_00745 [Candidatus Aminicenantes bacterium AC-335-A11]|jgi:hypothetical protein|nr:hypothetical protein [Candidatus Aminicenantes bacterium AC-335-A11]